MRNAGSLECTRQHKESQGLQIPTSNIQKTSKVQPSKSVLELGICNFSGCWMLEFGVFNLEFHASYNDRMAA